MATPVRQHRTGSGRKFNTTQPLGKVMVARGVTAIWVAQQAGIHPRTITEYLSGRKKILPHHLAALSTVLQVKPSRLIPTEHPPSM